MNTLKINNLELTYKNGHQAIRNISLEIKNGMFGLLGPNGAGKSSLMKTIVGLQKPSSGEIIFNDVDIVNNPDGIKKRLGFLPQDFGVYPKVNAYDLLSHIAILKGVNNKVERQKQIQYLLEKVNLWNFRDKEVHTFSGGMKQRFGVAQALLGDPKIIIVDEPTAGLDPEERNRFNTFLSDISSEVVVILSTHLVEDVKNLCSEMTIMNRGRILKTGKPKELIKELERQLQITVLAPSQPEGFSAVNPILEHVYFNVLYQNS
jgi:ABC-type multidrug transport system ATPase subunit